MVTKDFLIMRLIFYFCRKFIETWLLCNWISRIGINDWH